MRKLNIFDKGVALVALAGIAVYVAENYGGFYFKPEWELAAASIVVLHLAVRMLFLITRMMGGFYVLSHVVAFALTAFAGVILLAGESEAASQAMIIAGALFFGPYIATLEPSDEDEDVARNNLISDGTDIHNIDWAMEALKNGQGAPSLLSDTEIKL